MKCPYCYHEMVQGSVPDSIQLVFKPKFGKEIADYQHTVHLFGGYVPLSKYTLLVAHPKAWLCKRCHFVMMPVHKANSIIRDNESDKEKMYNEKN